MTEEGYTKERISQSNWAPLPFNGFEQKPLLWAMAGMLGIQMDESSLPGS